MADDQQDHTATSSLPTEPICATTYHRALLEYVQTHETELWNWFSSGSASTVSDDQVRLQLLKSAYRIEREDAARLYESADDIAARMSIDCPITIYQAQQASGLNASIAWLSSEAHIVLHGPVQETLNSEEIRALLAHELAHQELNTINDGAYQVLDQILAAMITDAAADASHDRTWRSHRLYTELHCDRRAAQITDNPESCVCALVKMETGLKDISAAAYIKQANEVLADGIITSDGVTHPEMFIRAKSLEVWQKDPDGADDTLRHLIEGPIEFKQLDLLRQQQLSLLTQAFLKSFLERNWLQTDLTRGHARRFFPTFELGQSDHSTKQLTARLGECDVQLREFFCYVLLDFVTCDADLEEGPLAAAFLFAEKCDLTEEFSALAAKELKLGKRSLQKVEHDAEKIVRAAEKEFSS